MFLNFQKIWHKKWTFIYQRKSVYNDDLRINMNLKRLIIQDDQRFGIFYIFQSSF